MIDFARLHPNSAIILRAEIQPKDPTERQRAYYEGYILNEMQNALYEAGEPMFKSQLDEYLISLCPILEGKHCFDDLDPCEVGGYLDWLYQWAAENYSKILDDAY